MNKVKRIFKRLAIALVLLMVLIGVIGVIGWNVLCSKYGITYSEAHYSITSGLVADDMAWDIPETSKGTIGHLELNVGLWSALFGTIKVDDLVLTDADISVEISPDPSSDSEISIAIDEAILTNVLFSYSSKPDSLSVFIANGEIEDFEWDGELELEMLTLDDSKVDIFLGEQTSGETPASQTGSENIFALIPALEIDDLALNQFDLNYHSAEKHISNSITLKLKDWEKDDVFEFSIDTLYGSVLDTLQIALHIGESEWSEKDEVSLIDLSAIANRSVARLNSVEASNFDNPQVFASLALLSAPLNEIEKYIGSLDGIVNPTFDKNQDIVIKGGDYSYADNKLTLSKSAVWLTDQTHLVASGEASWDSLVVYQFQLDDFQTTDQELKSILYPESFYNMYNWPPTLSGKVALNGNEDSLWVAGLLNTAWGNLDAYSGIDLRADSSVTYRINVKSDKANLYNFAEYITVPIRQADIDLRILGVTSDIETEEMFSMNISAETLLVDSFSIDTLHFSYQSVAQFDSMFVFVDDSLIQADVRAAITGEDSLNMAWVGKINHLSSTLAKSDLPLWAMDAKVEGEYKSIDDYFEVSLALSEPIIRDESEHQFEDFFVTISEMDTVLTFEAGWGNYLQSSGKLYGSFFFHTNSLMANPVASMSLIDVNLEALIDSSISQPIFGIPMTVFVEKCELKNTADGNLNWTAEVSELKWDNMEVEGLEINFDFEGIQGKGSIVSEYAQFGNADLQSLNMSLLANEQSHVWHLGIEDFYKEGRINLGVIETNTSEGYNFRLNPSDTLILFNDYQRVTDNTGLDFDSTFALQSGALGIESEQGLLLLSSKNYNEIALQVDSLKIAKIINPFLNDFQVEGLLSGQATYHVDEHTADYSYSIYDFKADTMPLGIWEGNGTYSQNEIVSNLKLLNDTIDSEIDILYGEELKYKVSLNAFELKGLNYFLPDDMELSGKLNCNLEGELGSDLNQKGWISFDQVTAVLPEIHTPYRLGTERIIVEGDKVIFNSFEIFDTQSNAVLVTGEVEIFPDLKYNLALKGRDFKFLDNPKGKGVEGNLAASVDLQAKGENQKHLLTGNIDIHEGGKIRYTVSDQLSEDNSLGELEFVSFDEVESHSETENEKLSTVFADFDIAVNLATTNIDVVLNPVSQEFVELLAQGHVKVKKSGYQKPAVFGKITSNDGKAYISLPIVPAIRMDIEEATAEWDGGPILEPLVSFTGLENFNSSMDGISTQNPNEIVPVTVEVIMLKSNPLSPQFTFDVRSSNPELNSYLQAKPEQNRETLATNLLLFGTLSPGGSDGSNMALNGVSEKLNEILHRNLKYTDLSFSVDNSKSLSTSGNEVSHSELDYRLKQQFLNDRLSVYLSGSVLSTSDSPEEVPPSQLIGDFGVEYKLGDTSNWSVIGARNTSYTGVIDGQVTQYKLGFKFSRSYPDFRSFFIPAYRKSIETPAQNADDTD